MSRTIIDIARTIAATGLPVFPCAADKRPAISEREGGHGLRDASTVPAELARLFRHPRACLVGVPSGERSGIDILDLDYRHGAGTWQAAHAAELPETQIHESMSGGRHLLFEHVHGVRNSAGRIGLGVDVRGEGGYAVWPPSRGYCVIHDVPIAHWPDWLLQPGLALPRPAPARLAPAITSPCYDRTSCEQARRVIERALDRVRAAAEGQKHSILRNMSVLIGGTLAASGIDDGTAIGWLLAALPRTVEDWRTAEKTAASGLQIGRTTPLELPPAPPPPQYSRAIARTAFALLRTRTPTDRAWKTLQAKAERLGVPVEQARRIHQWAITQHQARRGGRQHSEVAR